MQEAAKARAPASRRLPCQRVIRKARQEASDRDAALEPGEVESRTGVNAGAKRDMAIRRARDIEATRIAELRRIAVGGPDAQRDARFGRQLDAADHGRLRR